MSVVLIDDNSDDRCLAEVLLCHGLPDVLVHTIENPVALGEFIAREAPDAALIERNLQWCDCLGLVRKIKALNPDCIVILYSHEGLQSLTPEWAELGLAAFFTKTSGNLVKIPTIIRDKLEVALHTQVSSGGVESRVNPTEVAATFAEEPIDSSEPEAKFLSEMFYSISHDLMQPLQIFVRQARLLDENYKGQLDTSGQSLITNLGQVANHMQLLLDSILSYYRLDTDAQDDQKADIAESLEIVLATLGSSLKDISGKVIVGKLPELNLSKGNMVQLFQNLIGNAIKFRSQQPLCIEIDVLDVSGNWLFTVKDNGIGVEESSLDGIFGMFKRLHGQNEYPGNGIGLALCKRIIEQQGGKIWARSKPKEGTAIYFTIPKQAESSAEQNGIEGPDNEPAHKGIID